MADALRLAELAHRGRLAVARDRELAADDEAFRALVDDGADLLAALSDVVQDEEFWDRLRTAAAGNALLPPDERDALETLLDTELAAVLEALQYSPPPELEALLEETLSAVVNVLESQLSAQARTARIRDLEFELSVFTWHLERLVARTSEVAPAHARRRLRNAVYTGSGTAIALAITAAGIGAEAGFGALGAGAAAARIGGRAGELLAEAMAERARAHLTEPARSDAEFNAGVDAIEPTVRVKVFARLVESRLARAASDLAPLRETLEAALMDACRLARADERSPHREQETADAIGAVISAINDATESLSAGDNDKALEEVLGALELARWVRVVADPEALAQHCREEAERREQERRQEEQRRQVEEEERLRQEEEERLLQEKARRRREEERRLEDERRRQAAQQQRRQSH
jgi:hypothetical protein